MKLATAALGTCLLFWVSGDAHPQRNRDAASGFPNVVRVRLWHFHSSATLKLKAESGQAKFRTCASCPDSTLDTLALRATRSRVQVNGDKSGVGEVRVSGVYEVSDGQMSALKADFPSEIRAADNKLLITAAMPMDEYLAGVLAGETGNFKSDETLKAMAVIARTYALHFGARHALDGFDFCDATHCQSLRLNEVTPRLRKIVESTNGEALWYDGEPAATYYHANCGGMTEDGRYILGNDEQRAPYLKQHSDTYCVRNGSSQWRSEVSRQELQRALAAEGIAIPGRLRSLTVAKRTPSGRVEFLTVTGNQSVTVPGLTFRFAVGRNIGWERLKSNWYEVHVENDRIVFNGRGSGHGVGLCQVGAEVMGEEGHSYREILSFYYPGTRVGASAQGLQWQQLTSEDAILLSTRPESDRAVLALTTRLIHEAEESTGLFYAGNPKIKVYPTVAAFRDATGEPGWIAASTRGSMIRLQPVDVLRDAGTLETTLRHELLHLLIESHAKPGTPLWFREGLVLYLSQPGSSAKAGGTITSDDSLNKALRSHRSEDEMRRAYADARGRVTVMIAANGKGTVIQWLQEGLPKIGHEQAGSHRQ